MKNLPLSARIYILLVTLLAVGVIFESAYLANQDRTPWLIIIGTAAIIGFLDMIPIKPYGSSVEMTIANVAKFAAVILFPPPVSILATFLGTLLGEVRSRRPWFKRLFNVAVMTLTIAIVAAIYYGINQPPTNLLASIQSILALFFAGLADFGVASILVSLIISFAQQVPFRYVWLQNFSRVIWHDLSMIPLGTFVAVLWQFNPITVPLVVLPLFVVRHSYQTANHLQRQTEDALRALMRAIDERDNETFDHSERVSKLAKDIGKALDMPPSELDVLVPAALLHDLGKIGMAGAILFKPGALTEDERLIAQKHSEVGGELLSKFPLFEKGAALVRHHHERYDGGGYPGKLKGGDIPLGARIIAVADSYNAMTEDRPYRKAMSQDEALAEIFRCSGTQFDPRVVEALMRTMGKNTPLLSAAIQMLRLPQDAA